MIMVIQSRSLSEDRGTCILSLACGIGEFRQANKELVAEAVAQAGEALFIPVSRLM